MRKLLPRKTPHWPFWKYLEELNFNDPNNLKDMKELAKKIFDKIKKCVDHCDGHLAND